MWKKLLTNHPFDLNPAIVFQKFELIQKIYGRSFKLTQFVDKDDEIEWFEDLSGEREDDIADEVSNLIEAASLFYDKQIEGYE